MVYGGLIGGILTAYVYCRIKKVDFWAAFDIAAPVIALAQGFGRIGCFLAGAVMENTQTVSLELNLRILSMHRWELKYFRYSLFLQDSIF